MKEEGFVEEVALKVSFEGQIKVHGLKWVVSS